MRTFSILIFAALLMASALATGQGQADPETTVAAADRGDRDVVDKRLTGD